MKKIVKQAQPTELQQWRSNNAEAPQNLKYGCGGFPRDAVLNALLAEQGYLCAYTLLKISSNKAHVEHLKPQTRCRREDDEREQSGIPRLHEDVAWMNMVACFPHPDAEHPGYGAVQKDKWWDETLFLSPLADNCGSRFSYKNDGSIAAAVTTDSAAKETIKKLKLGCNRLQDARQSAIYKAGLHKRAPKPLKSTAKVQAFIQKLSQKQSGDFVEFCTVLEQVGLDYIQSLQKRAQRRRHACTQGR
jgi:uncharacterized protein (TIGR02646 family)